MNSFEGSSEKNLAAHALGGFFLQLGYSRKYQIGEEGWGYFFLKNTGIFRFATLPFETPQQASFHHWKLSKIVCHSLETLRKKNQDPWKFYFFFNWHLEFPHTFSSLPLEIPFPVLVKEKYLTWQKINRRIAICKYSNLDKANKPQPIKFISGLNLKLQETACRLFQIAVRRGERGNQKFCWEGGFFTGQS